MEGTRNRKQRRAAAAAAAAKQPRSTDAFDPASVPLAHPPTTNHPTGKTLVDIIAERQGELLGQLSPNGGAGTGTQTQFVTVDPRTGAISAVDEGSLSSETKRKARKRAEKARWRQQQQQQQRQGNGENEISGGEDEEDEDEDEDEDEEEEELEHPIPPVIDTLLLAVPLATLHLTLAYLAAHQYAQEIELEKLVRDSAFVALPMLALLIHLAHGHVVSFVGAPNRETLSLLPWDSEKQSWAFMRRLLFPPSLRTVVFLPLTAFLGCRLMIMTNEDPYYAVMKHAPAFGTMWIWGVLEMSFGPAVLGALGPLIWGVWWMGYGIL
ncbi:hypothetical protein BO82DRAFT_59891 [Aspergillus uvarum CBS 121591]|uniref:DUF7719 domain-containing protein n=1 Tax=Aspergillus uvarum CBS 121591 TaxID=1448315 RepID=A0A319CUV3_9EURO|nr:hypothetical protein BO82DRAFT_59891 [Aspergillus uvarum CBS 121591]PYH82613.1 hypothetical protein BO82DRAFT_59891 [Aspergillus uvarum CBS 121591]